MKVIQTSGKRKKAIARATIKPGKGLVRVNKRPVQILSPELARQKILEPIVMAGDKIKKLDIEVNVQGGGIMGQADATRTAIARGIVAYLESKELESLYKERDRTLLASDPRRKMPKKPMGRGARKKRQKSYR
ncbi:MAG: 30S ribosomal protein S9 [Thermoplasmata archaeon]|jgi:small subunit ribosomal protein S9|nr:30S ribosomal protein S9 [Candidatus Thermoplasmatota archaeon]MCK4949061.1 30S ribosomal protein S9 [Thermoplasmata archaeon]